MNKYTQKQTAVEGKHLFLEPSQIAARKTTELVISVKVWRSVLNSGGKACIISKHLPSNVY